MIDHSHIWKIQQMNITEANSLPFIDSKLFWYLFLSESKIYFMTSPATSFDMISMSSLFECITYSSSLF